MGSFMSAFSPFFFHSLNFRPAAGSVIYLMLTLPIFGSAAFLMLRAGVRITRAEALVKNQQKHLQSVIATK
jgi:hypothetical protein